MDGKYSYSYEADVLKIKLKIAVENANYFKQRGISLEGKRVLDVGFGLGYNASIMKRLGAEVFGVEPNKDDFDFAVSNNLIDKDKAFNCLLQDIPQELLGTFDVATVFLYNINFNEREAFAQTLSQVIKPDGITIIGISDEIYISGDDYQEPVSASIGRFFNSLQSTRCNYNIANRFFITASEPKIIDKRLW